MATLAYPPFRDDAFGQPLGMSRSRSRRQSVVGYAGQQPVGFPYSDHPGMYTEPPMPVGLHEESYPQPPYQIYAGQPDRRSQHIQAFDDLAVRESYYPEERRISPALSHSSVIPNSAVPLRQRRHSTSVAFEHAPPMDTFRRLSSITIKLKRKGAFRSGITIGDAQSNVRLSGADSYTFRDFNADIRGRISLKIKWTGYPSLTYDIPLDGYGERVNLQTLVRRTSRAIVHFLQTNIIPIPWDCVEILRLEEVAPGTWQPVLAVR